MDTKRTDIILEVIYKMSLSPNFKNTPGAIENYIIQLQDVYDNNEVDSSEINTNDDLIKRAGLFPEINDIIPIYKCPFPDSFKQDIEFIQTPISSDGNCLFSCLAYLDEWNRHSHNYVRDQICNNLNTLINILRTELIDGYSYFQILLKMSYDDQSNQIKFNTDKTNQEYIKQMRILNAWGSGIEILTAIFITGQDINLYIMKEYRDKNIGELEYDFTYIKNSLIKSNKIEIDTKLKQPLNIYFCGGKHYELLQPKNATTYLKQPDTLRTEKDREEIFKIAEGLLRTKHSNPKVIAQMHEEVKQAALSTQLTPPTPAKPTIAPAKPTIAPHAPAKLTPAPPAPAKLTPAPPAPAKLTPTPPALAKNYICISDPEGEFSDPGCNKASIKPSSLSTQIHHVLDEDDQVKDLVIDEIMSEIMGTLEYSMELYEFHSYQLNQLYSAYRKEGFQVDIHNFRIIVQDSPDFKHLFPYMCSFTNAELKSKFTEIPTLNNGNCLFQSLQLGIEQWKMFTPSNVREIICNNLFNVIVQIIVKINSDIIYNEISKPLKLSDESHPITDPIIIRYVEYMRKEGSFGGLLEIITAIFLTQHDIVIYNMKGQVNPQYDSIKTKLTQEALLKIDQGKPTVYLYHCNRTADIDTVEHYELLVEKPVSYKYKYMKYKMKYLTLKNNTHYNKYL
jgi:hypothetical protein